MARVETTPALFRSDGDPQFYVRFTVRNTTDRRIGVDLRDYFHGPRPNQWGGLREPRRDAIDEERSVLVPADAVWRREVRSAFAAGTLDVIAPRASLDVYVPFNNGGHREIDAAEAAYIYVSLDGAMDVTDGRRVERAASFAWTESGVSSGATIYVASPVAWREMPDGARIVRDD